MAVVALGRVALSLPGLVSRRGAAMERSVQHTGYGTMVETLRHSHLGAVSYDAKSFCSRTESRFGFPDFLKRLKGFQC
jgi:hypothetical protein